MTSIEITSIIIGAALTGFIGYLWDRQKKGEDQKKKDSEEMIERVNKIEDRVNKCEWEIDQIKTNQNRHDATTDKVFGILAEIQSTLGEIKERLAKVES